MRMTLKMTLITVSWDYRSVTPYMVSVVLGIDTGPRACRGKHSTKLHLCNSLRRCLYTSTISHHYRETRE